jgi:hypothetical protein
MTAPASGSCGLDHPAFCDTFDTPSPGGRAGDLDDKEWSAARISTGNNLGQGNLNAWLSTTTSACGVEKTGVLPGDDMFFCAGGMIPSMHFNDSYNDGQGFDMHSYRIRRMFDFTDRTGIIAFDVGGKAQTPGGHGWWFNVFIASDPVPAPYQQGGGMALYTKAGVGIEFLAADSRGPCLSKDPNARSNSVSNIFIEKDYAIVSTPSPPDSILKCFKTEEEVLNHIEVHISQTKIEVFASDAGDPMSFRSIAVADHLSLPLTRGYVSFQHTHYNAAKSGLLPAYTTYHWDNVGFDGPSYATPRAYEVPDSMTPNPNGFAGGVNVGYALGKDGIGGKSPSVTLDDVDLTGATGATLTLNAWDFLSNDAIGYRFNSGSWRTFDHPFPNSDASARAVAIPVDLSDLKSGANTLEMNSKSGSVIVADVDLSVQ